MSAHESRRAIVAAFLANLGIAAAKLTGFAFTASASMLAEGIHSVVDTSNQALLMLGGRQAQQQATPEHPFGFSRARYFWAFVVALMLFSLGGLFAIFEGVEKVRDPHEVESLWVAIAILAVAIVAETFSLRTAARSARGLRAGRTWWRFVREAKNPELPVVLLEDLGALTGLAFALAGVVLAHVLDDARWDAAGSLAIGVLLVVIAFVLAREMRSLLIGEAASERDQEAIRRAMASGDDVVRIIHLRTQHLGPDDLVVAAKVEFTSTLTLPEVAARIDALEARVRAAVPAAKTIFVEPDVYREA